MRDEDKPFILYRIGRLNSRIRPRGWAGTRLMIGWIALGLPMVAGFVTYASSQPEGQPMQIGHVIFMLAIAAWAIGGTLWMRSRAEVVDCEELLKLKHERDAEQRRR